MWLRVCGNKLLQTFRKGQFSVHFHVHVCIQTMSGGGGGVACLCISSLLYCVPGWPFALFKPGGGAVGGSFSASVGASIILQPWFFFFSFFLCCETETEYAFLDFAAPLVAPVQPGFLPLFKAIMSEEFFNARDE